MSAIANAAYVEPIAMGGLTFGPDYIVGYDGHQFSTAWPHFKVSEVEDSIKVGSGALDPNVVYPLGGHIVSKKYMHSLPDDLWANWRAFNVCSHPHFPANYILDPTPMSYGACYTVVMPSSIHLGAFLRQSDAEHPLNVSFLMIVEASPSDPPRYRVNVADFFFKARRELPSGTILYADLSALFEFLLWTPEAARNADDHDWIELFPEVVPGVCILEAGCVSAGSSGPACSSLPEDSSSAVESRVSDNRGARIPRAQDSSAALGVISLADSPPRAITIPCSEFLVDDSSTTAVGVVVRPSRLAIAQAFLTPREERTKTKVAAIAAARAGQVPSRSSREGGYMAIPLLGSIHRDWMAMISFLVTELEVSGRTVSDADLRQLRNWTHNYGAVLRRTPH